MIDLEELKKLPVEEKLRIIDELEVSIEGEEEYDPSLLQKMEQRYYDVRSGKMQTIPGKEAEKILLTNREKRVVNHA